MNIVFVSDIFHHHQKGVAEALYRLTNKQYCFITTSPMSEERKNMGFANEYPEYVFDVSDLSGEKWEKAQVIINEADVVVIGAAPLDLIKKRLREDKLTFIYSERFLKQYKNYLKTPVYALNTHFKMRGCRLLCASAFASHDYNMIGAFKGVCYKWGYFTEVPDENWEKRINCSSDLKIMWCSRFLNLKHPELPVYLAKRLKDKGYCFSIDMYGSGKYLERTKKLAQDIGVSDVVFFCGNVSNKRIIDSMKESDIFLFTSDRGEGWGAVANEAMSNGCVLVASDEIGSVPYLVKHKENGCVFKSSSRRYGFHCLGVNVDTRALVSLEKQVEWLINNPEERKRLSMNAIRTMRKTWSPETAAQNFMILIDDIRHGRDTSICCGPCSKA